MILFMLLQLTNADIYAWDIERQSILNCIEYQTPIPECLHTDYSRIHIKQFMNFTVRLWTNNKQEPIPKLFLANDSGSLPLNPVLKVTRDPFVVLTRIPKVDPGRYEIKLNEFPIGIRVMIDDVKTLYPMKSGTVNNDSQNHVYLWLIALGIIPMAAAGYYIHSKREKKAEHVELLSYEDEFESLPLNSQA